jgi:hypothetical protein
MMTIVIWMILDAFSHALEAKLLNRSGPESTKPESNVSSPTASRAASPVNIAGAESPKAEGEKAATPRPRPRAVQPPLTLQDVQQMLIQAITTRKIPRQTAKDAMAQRAAAVQQRTRESAPLNRPQFIEVMLRTALVLKGPHQPSTSKAFKRFSEKIIRGRIMLPPLSPFPRGLPLQVGEVCDILLARRKTIREAWERFGGSDGAFQRLAQLLKLCDRSFTAKHVASIYALSRRPQPDLKVMKVRGLAYDEFCEAIARLALIWQRGSRAADLAGGPVVRTWPPQPQVGQPVRQRAVGARLEAFLTKVAERLRPAVRGTPF